MKSRTFLNILSLALLAPLCLAPLYAQGDAADAEPKKAKKEKKPSMSLRTAFGLSFKNLISKKEERF